jgi:O-antigen ligase/polysaccharide polymerase Wzy-like membrane protein
MFDSLVRKPGSAASVPDPTPLLFFIAAVSVGILLTTDTALLALILPGFVLSLLAAYWLSSRPYITIILLAVGSVMPRLFVEVGGTKVRPEHAAIALVCMAIPFWYYQDQEKRQWLFADALLILYIGMNLFSSYFSVAPAAIMKWSLQQIAGILPYFFVRFFVSDAQMFRRAFRVLLAVGVAEAVFGLLCLYSNQFFGTELGIEPGQYNTLPGTYGTQFEANIFASYCGACSVMLLAMYLEERSRKFLWGYAVTFAAMLVSLSRASVVATFTGYLLLVLYAYKKHLLNKQLVKKVALVSVMMVVIHAPIVLLGYFQRFSTVDVSDVTADDNAMTRLVQLAVAFEDIEKHPVIGNGSLSFNVLFNWEDFGTGWESLGWIGNVEIRVQHDTGAIGLSLFTIFTVYLTVRSLKVLKRQRNMELLGLLIAGVVYFLAYQFTEGTLLAFSWFHVGLIGCAIAIHQGSGKIRDNHLALGRAIGQL